MEINIFSARLSSGSAIVLSESIKLHVIIAANDFPFGNRSRNMNIRTRAVIKIIFCNKFITQAFKKTQFSSSGKIILKYVKYIQ